MRRRARHGAIGGLMVLALALSGAGLGCGQEKTAIGGGNPFHFEMDVDPESGRVGDAFDYEIRVDILREGTVLEDLEVRLRVPKSLRLVRGLFAGATFNGLPAWITTEDETDRFFEYLFALGDVSEDPSTFRFQCRGEEVADRQFVYATMKARGTTSPTVSRQVDIEP